jgi:protein TonB
MFETAVIHPQAQGADRRAALLTASVGAHGLVIIAIIAAGLQSLRFPLNAPKELGTWSPIPVVELPIARGTTTAKPTPEASKPAVTPKTPTAPPTDSTPQIIPNDVPTVASGPAAASDAGSGAPGTGTGDGPVGIPTGEVGGLPPDLTSTKPAPQPETKIYRASEVTPPVVITRVSPDYPRLAQMARKSGWVIVECVIGQDGRTRDARVVGSSWEPFEKPALDAVSQWVFRPGLHDGVAVNSMFELRVTFTLH